MLNNINPFYIYEDKNCLYIKNINKKTEKISSNIISYCANFDNDDLIHICSVDTKGRLIHFTYKDGYVRKKVLCKVSNNPNNLKNMRLFIIEKYLNIFLVEESSLNVDTYRVSHYNFRPSNNNIFKFHFNNILKKDEFIYKLTIDDMHNMIFTYESPNSNREELEYQSLIFNTNKRKWFPSKSLLRSDLDSIDVNCSSTIKSDIFEYCYSIVYKK
ncbi:MAG: hypothetical protein RSG52_00740 [Terrisporobacter sp.]|uniref:hypothetical protein n=1 Tax=Terrisporobacter sp. TaxID=1965305 RepID=UPI002FC7CF35